MTGQQFEVFIGQHSQKPSRSRNEQRLSLTDRHLVPFIVVEHTVSFKAHDDQEGVEIRKITGKCPVEIVKRSYEIGTRYQRHLPVFYRDIMGTIVGQHGIVDSVLRQLGMQFTRFPVRPVRP